MKKILSVVLIIIAAVYLWRINNLRHAPGLLRSTRFLMDTYVTIQAEPSDAAKNAIEAALERMQEIDVKFNPLNPKSPLYSFNSYGTPIADKEIVELIRRSLEISRQTNGAFDITVFPLVKLWGFYDKQDYLPDSQEITECLKRVGYNYLAIEGDKVIKLKDGVGLDLGGIAKGYAVDEAVRVLKQAGIRSAIIEAGGDIYAIGNKYKNKQWKIGIRSPRGDALLGYIYASDTAVIGSGDYERYFIKDNIRYHHIFDPKTGYPSRGLSGITLIYNNAALADAWATALFVLGAEKAILIVESIPGMEVIMVRESQEVLFSKGAGERFKTMAE